MLLAVFCFPCSSFVVFKGSRTPGIKPNILGSLQKQGINIAYNKLKGGLKGNIQVCSYSRGGFNDAHAQRSYSSFSCRLCPSKRLSSLLSTCSGGSSGLVASSAS